MPLDTFGLPPLKGKPLKEKYGVLKPIPPFPI